MRGYRITRHPLIANMIVAIVSVTLTWMAHAYLPDSAATKEVGSLTQEVAALRADNMQLQDHNRILQSQVNKLLSGPTYPLEKEFYPKKKKDPGSTAPITRLTPRPTKTNIPMGGRFISEQTTLQFYFSGYSSSTFAVSVNGVPFSMNYRDRYQIAKGGKTCTVWVQSRYADDSIDFYESCIG